MQNAATSATMLTPAKLNLTLRVGPLRPDGYHPIESLVCRLSLADTLQLTLRDDPQFTLACDDPAIPCDDRNLALRAARRLAGRCPVTRGVHIEIAKRIPPGAGLGGGSSNAAGTLRLLQDRLWCCGLSACELAELAAELGSDVPYFLDAGAAVLRGRGEAIRRVTLPGWLASSVVVLILPPLHCGTAEVYRAFDGLPPTQPGHAPELLLNDAADPGELMLRLYNDLEPAAYAVCPELARLRATIEAQAGGPLRMTGSGAAHFRLFGDNAAADSFAARVRQAVKVRVEVCTLTD